MTHPISMRRARWTLRLVVPTLALCMLLGCAPEPEPMEMETVELGVGPTDRLTAEDDAVEATAGTSGLSLPSGFPRGLPVPPSASIVSSARGRTTFGTEDAAERTRAQLERELERAGWTEGADGRYQRDGRSVRITFEPQPDRTLVVYRY